MTTRKTNCMSARRRHAACLRRGDRQGELGLHPSAVLTNLYQLANINYGATHRFLTDGTPEVGDICPSVPCSASTWRTILVGGLNAGGSSFYALDVTDPGTPKLLWEFTRRDGSVLGNPRITKLNDGTWVVILSSASTTPTSPSAHLCPQRVHRRTVTSVNGTGIISTGIGTAANPSGLARMAVDVLDPLANNTVQAVYGETTWATSGASTSTTRWARRAMTLSCS
jgi:type IV pilus assembly protein PilY1